MNIELDSASQTPPYEQLVTQVTALAGNGTLSANKKLPTVRQLAQDLSLAPGTVAKAFRLLESAGVIETRGRHGTFITLNARSAVAQNERQALLDEAAETFAIAAKQLKFSAEEAISAFQKALRAD